MLEVDDKRMIVGVGSQAEGRGINHCVLLDCRHLGRTFLQERLGQIYAEAKTFANIDLAEDPLPIRPGMHYQMAASKPIRKADAGILKETGRVYLASSPQAKQPA